MITAPGSGLLASTITATMTGSLSPTTEVTITGTVAGQTGHAAPTGAVELFSSGYGDVEVGLVPGTGTSSTFTITLNSQSLSFHRRSGATVNRYIATLSHLFSFAVKERRLIDRNPVGDIRRKKEPRGRTRFLSDEERAALIAACARSDWPPLHALVLLAITTGARRGELVSLKWADVDLKGGRATIHDTKNGEQRTLPLAGKALEAYASSDFKTRRAVSTCFPRRPWFSIPRPASRSSMRL